MAKHKAALNDDDKNAVSSITLDKNMNRVKLERKSVDASAVKCRADKSNNASQTLHISDNTKSKLVQNLLANRKSTSHIDVKCKTVKKGPVYACKFCSQYFSATSLARHVLEHTGKNYPFVCRRCQKGFLFKSDLKRHEARHAKK